MKGRTDICGERDAKMDEYIPVVRLKKKREERVREKRLNLLELRAAARKANSKNRAIRAKARRKKKNKDRREKKVKEKDPMSFLNKSGPVKRRKGGRRQEGMEDIWKVLRVGRCVNSGYEKRRKGGSPTLVFSIDSLILY